jgi:hypothetical protein
MVRDDEAEDRGPWGMVPRLAGGAVTVPVVAAFVTLGAAVIVVRSVRDVARHGWTRLAGARNGGTSRPGRRNR